MTKSALLASTAIALIMCIAPAIAQVQQKDDKAPNAQQKAEPRDKGAARDKEQPSKGNARNESKDSLAKDSAQKSEPKEKSTKGSAEKSEPSKSKGTAEKANEPKEKSTKGTAEKAPQPQDKTTKGATGTESKEKGTAEKSPSAQDKSKGAAGADPKDKGTAEQAKPSSDKAAGQEKSTSGRVQISEQQRTTVHQTILKESNVNRVTNVNISINVGTRVPRSVTLVALPASVISLVPEYRSYRYFVVDDRICIVDPNTYEIVEVITVSGQSASREDRGGQAKLVLTDEEKRIILSEVDMRGGSTLGLGVLTEGADVPREIEVREFSATIVDKVPKVKGFKFFTAENRLAIVDQRGAKVVLIVEDRR